jgi:hypothetical protein
LLTERTRRAIVDIPRHAEQYEEEPLEEHDPEHREPGYEGAYREERRDGGDGEEGYRDLGNDNLQLGEDDAPPTDEDDESGPHVQHPYTTIADDENLPIVGEVDDDLGDVTSPNARQEREDRLRGRP